MNKQDFVELRAEPKPHKQFGLVMSVTDAFSFFFSSVADNFGILHTV